MFNSTRLDRIPTIVVRSDAVPFGYHILRDSNADRAAQCDNPNELMSPPEKNVPMILPRVTGKSRCDGCDSS
jgi:hypothetical protein